MKQIKFDFNNMMSFNVGAKDGVTEADLSRAKVAARKAYKHLQTILKNERSRISLGLEWARLPFQDKDEISRIQRLGDEIAAKYDNVISLGIGGSYLGLKAAQDALKPPYYNEFSSARSGRPRIYFDGNNLDPDTISVLLKNLDPKKTFVIVISKSGETTETKAAFAVVEQWLKKGIGRHYGRQVIAVTDPSSGTLRKKVNLEQSRDALSFRDLPVMKGVGGRFSELNIGLLHLAIIGVDIREVLDGAGLMARRCGKGDLLRNPAAMYAMLHTILYRRKNKPISVMMPFAQTLKSTADWYVQLLAESLGKKYARRVEISKNGEEAWRQDERKTVNVGRTPVSSSGTGDLHSIQQNNIEGENNKAVTFIKVESFREDVKVYGTGDFLEGKPYSRLLSIAQEACEWALALEKRPSCTITLPRITPFFWGELLFFFEMATAFEGELLGVNAFDQPGVEGYKNYMYYKLGKKGLPRSLESGIKSRPLIKDSKFIV